MSNRILALAANLQLAFPDLTVITGPYQDTPEAMDCPDGPVVRISDRLLYAAVDIHVPEDCDLAGMAADIARALTRPVKLEDGELHRELHLMFNRATPIFDAADAHCGERLQYMTLESSQLLAA